MLHTDAAVQAALPVRISDDERQSVDMPVQPSRDSTRAASLSLSLEPTSRSIPPLHHNNILSNLGPSSGTSDKSDSSHTVSVCTMGSVSILQFSDCDICHHLTWPVAFNRGDGVVCVRCKSMITWQEEFDVILIYQMSMFFPHFSDVWTTSDVLRRYLQTPLYPIWYRAFLRHHLLSRGEGSRNSFHKLTYYYNDMAGSFDQYNDDLDILISFVI